ncbi:MAG TPA: hypothetical protein DCQ30_13065 [Acidimicrobiaceae bacterium]|nr:hypothetical protein [Acidimicrobiaceae bacterium]
MTLTPAPSDTVATATGSWRARLRRRAPGTTERGGPVRIEALFLIGVAVFFSVVDAIYWFWGYHYLSLGPEQSGTVMLIGTVLLGLLPGGYYFWWSRRMKPRPEDRTDASIEDGAGVIGSFPDSSVWPFVLGMGLFLVVLAVVFGLWLLFPGFALVIAAAVGVTVESRRGGAV